jgi:hypothetical protein
LAEVGRTAGPVSEWRKSVVGGGEGGIVLAMVRFKSCCADGRIGIVGGESVSGVSVIIVAFGSKFTVGWTSDTSRPPSCVQNFCASSAKVRLHFGQRFIGKLRELRIAECGLRIVK